MAIKRHILEDIIFTPREADVALAQGARVADVCRQWGITEQTYYRWRKEYGGLKTSRAKLVAGLSLDKQIPSEALKGNFQALNAAANVSIMSELRPGA